MERFARSGPSVTSRQAPYPSPLSKAHRLAHSTAAPFKIKAIALILCRKIDFRRQPCEAKASQGDLRKSIRRGAEWMRRTTCLPLWGRWPSEARPVGAFKSVGASRHHSSTLNAQLSTLNSFSLYSVGETPWTLRKAAANLLALS